MHNLLGRRTMLVVLAWVAVVAWALAIFVLSSQPGDPGSGLTRLRLSWEKVAHFTVYAVLSLGIANALTASGVRSRRYWWTFVMCALYAVTDEIHQFLVPGRSPSIYDVAIDLLGATAGFIAYEHLVRWGDRVPIRAVLNRTAEVPRVRMRRRGREAPARDRG
ncbi:MAG TPA: VanZ family protein [Candidatus Limnocylindria bacterium]|nr:VanZ family protein [Candidatus Limnocylindria bacterium]